MGKPAQDVVLLFSYGTLRDGAVQMANFGRLLAGRADALPGYAIVPIEILDPAVVALSGKAQHMIAIRGDAADEVSGVVFEITAEELAAADRYEVADYARVLATLKSGVKSWVYVGARDDDAYRLTGLRANRAG
ncbi:MAG TPA: gamma-glutamylcyclotransferase family protein [Steroidobacteraceae bacterium]